MVDELIYSELAREPRRCGEPLLRDQPDPGYSVVYPLLIARPTPLFDSLPDAYAAREGDQRGRHVARRGPGVTCSRGVSSRDGLALLAALLAVAVPSMAYTGTVMTENVFYPLFLAVALVLVLALERPDAGRVVVLFALLALAFATRVQAVASLPAFVRAVRARRVRATGARVDGFAVPLALRRHRGPRHRRGRCAARRAVARRRAPRRLRAGRRGRLRRSARLCAISWWHVAELSLYVLVIPLAATIVLVGRARSLDGRLQAFLAATVSLTVCLVPVVAVFASRFSDRIEERNIFYVAPLF